MGGRFRQVSLYRIAGLFSGTKLLFFKYSLELIFVVHRISLNKRNGKF